MTKIEKLITITKIGDKDKKFWIKDEAGEFYSGFKDWQGADTTEWSLVQHGNHGEPFKEGQQALIEFTKTAGTDKEGKDVIYKNLKAIYPADTTPKPNRLEKPHGGANSASGGLPGGNGQPPKGDTFWDMKAYKQCLWGYALQKGLDTFSPNDCDLVWAAFKAIETDAEKRFNPSALREAVQRHAPSVAEELPTIDVADDISEMAKEMADQDVSGIPF